MLGTVLGDYRVEARIGEGGTASLYKARHKTTGKTVAIKVLLEEGAADPVAQKRLIQEARAAMAVRHPNIVEIVAIGQGPDGSPWLAMELLDGLPLDAVQHKLGGKLTPHQTAVVLVQALDGLGA